MIEDKRTAVYKRLEFGVGRGHGSDGSRSVSTDLLGMTATKISKQTNYKERKKKLGFIRKRVSFLIGNVREIMLGNIR